MMLRAMLFVSLVALTGCSSGLGVKTSRGIPAEAWQYQPNSASATDRLPVSLAVAPFEDRREYKPATTSISPYESSIWYYSWSCSDPSHCLAYATEGLEWYPRMFTRWLAVELEAAGLARSTRYTKWSELAATTDVPEFIVTGAVADGMGCVLLCVDISLLRPSSPRQPVWERRYDILRLLKEKPGSLVYKGTLFDPTHAVSADNMRIVYEQVRIDLAAALKEQLEAR